MRAAVPAHHEDVPGPLDLLLIDEEEGKGLALRFGMSFAAQMA
jgi:hypothetical protein